MGSAPRSSMTRFHSSFRSGSIGQSRRRLSLLFHDMGVSDSYRDFVLDQLGRVNPVRAKRMFGGVGIYSRGLFFALIAEGRLYFKVDDATRPDFERLDMEPFRPFGEDSAMGYYE